MNKAADTLSINITEIRKQFPILSQKVNGNPLIYFDNGATTQKPLSVINAIDNYYKTYNSNIHRGVHHLSVKATEAYEEARRTIQQFIGAEHEEEIIFTKGTTDAINLVAHSFSKEFIQEGDEIIISGMEHHSNIVPWQMACEERKAILKVIPVFDNGEISVDDVQKLISDKTKIIAITHSSNTLGTNNPIEEIISIAKSKGIKTLIDGAQAIHHQPINVKDLGCDFYAFSGHKMYGPTGVGILYGKQELLKKMPPYQGGGDMIKTVTFEKTTYNDLPHKFEAGTPNIVGGITIAEAAKWISSIGFDTIQQHDNEILNYATEKLSTIEGVKIYGTSKKKGPVISFLIDNIHPFDLGTILDQLGIAVRTGHHCTEPLMNRFKIPGTVRASFAIYNTLEEVDVFIEGVKKAKKMLS